VSRWRVIHDVPAHFVAPASLEARILARRAPLWRYASSRHTPRYEGCAEYRVTLIRYPFFVIHDVPARFAAPAKLEARILARRDS